MSGKYYLNIKVWREGLDIDRKGMLLEDTWFPRFVIVSLSSNDISYIHDLEKCIQDAEYTEVEPSITHTMAIVFIKQLIDNDPSSKDGWDLFKPGEVDMWVSNKPQIVKSGERKVVQFNQD